MPLTLSDQLAPLFRDIFPDSLLAQQYASRQTKTACIINGALAPYYKGKMIQVMKEGPFALAIDGSTDTGVEKKNPLTV